MESKDTERKDLNIHLLTMTLFYKKHKFIKKGRSQQRF